MNAYRAAQADAHWFPTVILRYLEHRQRATVETSTALTYEQIGRLAALRDTLKARGVEPPAVHTLLAPQNTALALPRAIAECEGT